ncbi:MAG: hypothetical protein SGILL_003333 [Bacillariaceae sp.]
MIEDLRCDEFSLHSCHPSDEWGEKAAKSFENNPEEDPEEPREEHLRGVDETSPENPATDETSWFSKPDNKSYLSNSSFAEYLSHIIPGRFTNGCTSATDTKTDTRAGDTTRDEVRTERSSHSRCYIENTESIRDRRDDRGRRDAGRNSDARDDAGNNDAVYSVEEFTQISEITMDIPTVIAETKFAACSGLPTIEEARRFDPAIAACTANFSRQNAKAHCGAGDTGVNDKSGSNKDVIDFVFELVEDTFCVPLNRSKAEKKKAFIEAYHEESVKFARTNSIVDPWQSSSKHSRSNRTARRSGKSPGQTLSAKHDSDSFDPVEVSSPSPSQVSKGKEASFTIVDRPPSAPHGAAQTPETLDEEQTLDWSKIMSFAEKQLEADEKSVLSKAELSKTLGNRMDRQSFFPASNGAERSRAAAGGAAATAATNDTSQEGATTTASSLSNSSSTHATAADTTNISENVQDLRDFSAMDSSSFEEEPRRLLLTSLLLQLFLRIIPRVRSTQNQMSSTTKRNAEMLSEATRPLQEQVAEGAFHKIFRLVYFALVFLFWPSGIPRKKPKNTPMPKKPEKPSLLKLVFEADAPRM